MDKENQLKTLENAYLLVASQLEWVEDALEGKQLHEFALSFPVVRKAYDIRKERDELVLEFKSPRPPVNGIKEIS